MRYKYLSYILMLLMATKTYAQADSTGVKAQELSVNYCFTSYFVHKGDAYFDPYAMMSATPPSGPIKISGADSETFKTICCDFAKDKNRVYYCAQVIAGADAASFSRFGGEEASAFLRDKNAVYNSKGVRLKNSDSQTFKRLNRFYFRDKNQLYAEATLDSGTGVIIEKADPNAYEIVNELFLVSNGYVFRLNKAVEHLDPYSYQALSDGYGRDKNSLFYHEVWVECGDPQTLKKLLKGRAKEEGYYCDKNQIYLNGMALRGASPDSYEIPKPFYLTSNGNVFYKGERIEGVDFSSFKMLSAYKLSKDKNHVYYENTILDKADAATFSVLFRAFASDKNHLYVDNQVLTDVDGSPITAVVKERLYKDNSYAYLLDYGHHKLECKIKVDGATLKPYTEDYYKDSYQVYYYTYSSFSPVKGADPKTFEMIGDYGLAKDKGGLFYRGEKVANVDGASFAFFGKNDSFAKDDNYLYHFNGTAEIDCKIKVDGKTLQRIEHSFYKDKNNIYHYDYQGKKHRLIVLEGADQETFRVDGGNAAEDKNYKYYNGERSKKSKQQK